MFKKFLAVVFSMFYLIISSGNNLEFIDKLWFLYLFGYLGFLNNKQNSFDEVLVGFY